MPKYTVSIAGCRHAAWSPTCPILQLVDCSVSPLGALPGVYLPVTIHNLRTIAPGYGELLALPVYLTWLLHVGPGFETCLVPLSCGKIYHSLRGTLQYVAAPLLMPARGSSLRWLLDRVWRALTPPTCMIYHRSSLTYTRVTGSVTIHNLRTIASGYGELLALLVYLTLPTNRNGVINAVSSTQLPPALKTNAICVGLTLVPPLQVSSIPTSSVAAADLFHLEVHPLGHRC